MMKDTKPINECPDCKGPLEVYNDKVTPIVLACSDCGQIIDDNQNESTSSHEGECLETTLIEYDHDLSEEDLREVASSIADLDGKQEQLEQERKMVAAQWSSRIKDAETMRKKYSKMYRDRSETRTADCFAYPDYASDLMLYICVDTCKLIFHRQLLTEERQMKISEACEDDLTTKLEEPSDEIGDTKAAEKEGPATAKKTRTRKKKQTGSKK
ncbi:MAG: hypothetical protein GY696_16045 [Gammaproteobacteria bacterium]|nr:hypothetical protein [Gammaproteobacteria bacterium]